MARIKQVTFSVVRTYPLYPFTGNSDDQYANIKPFASATVEFDSDETDMRKQDALTVKQVVKEAFAESTALVFEQMIDFKQELTRQFANTASRKRDRTAQVDSK